MPGPVRPPSTVISPLRHPLRVQMQRTPPSIEAASRPAERTSFDLASEVLLLGLLLYLPLSLGGVLPLSQVVLPCVAVAMALCLAMRCLLAASGEVVWTWVWIPLLALLGLVALQVTWLPLETLSAISPGTAETWQELAGGLTGSGAASESATLSLYRHATNADLRLLLSGALILLVVVHTHRHPSAVRRLLWGVALIGLAMASLALLQDVTDARRIFWFVEASGSIHGGPFVHPGHYSQFINLSMGAAMATLLMRASARAEGRPLAFELHGGATRGDRALIIFLVLGVLTIALSGSRNGLISMTFAGAATAALCHHTRFLRGIGWPLVGVLLIAFVGLCSLGLDPVYDRMATLGDPLGAFATRSELLRDSSELIGSYPLLGSGLGTFEVVFPMFDHSARSGTAAHAENEYVEVMAEMGVLGFALVALLVLGIFAAWKRYVGRHSDAPPRMAAVAYGLGFGLTAVAIHSTTDFGVEIPAVGTLLIVMGAVLIGSAARRVSTRLNARVACAAFSLAGAGWLLALIPGSVSAWEASQLWDRVEECRAGLEELDPEATDIAYREMIDLSEQAVALQPDRIDYRYWAILFEWSRAHANEVAELGPDASGADEVTPSLRAAAAKAQAELLELRSIAPTFGPLWSVAGQLGVRWLDDPDAARWIHRGRELAPHHPATCIASAIQLLSEGNEEQALATFRRAIEVGARPRAMIEVFQRDLQRDDLALEIAHGNLGLLVHLDGLLTVAGGDEDLIAELRAELRVELERVCEGYDAEPWMLSMLARQLVAEGEDERAVGLFLRHLTQVADSTLRYDLARALVRLERREEALMQLRDLLAIQPAHEGAKNLLVELRGG